MKPCNRSTCHTDNWQRLIPFELLTKVAAAKKFQLSIKVRLSVRLLLSLSHSLSVCLSLSLQLSVSPSLCPPKTIGQVCAFASLSNAIWMAVNRFVLFFFASLVCYLHNVYCFNLSHDLSAFNSINSDIVYTTLFPSSYLLSPLSISCTKCEYAAVTW